MTTNEEIRAKDILPHKESFEPGDGFYGDGPQSFFMEEKDLVQNVLAGNLAPAFDPAKENGPDGFAYHADDTVIYNGRSFVFEINKASGAWDNSFVREVPLSFIVGKILKKVGLIEWDISSFDGELIEILDNYDN